MCGGSGLGFERDGRAKVENGREEAMRKKRRTHWHNQGSGAA